MSGACGFRSPASSRLHFCLALALLQAWGAWGAFHDVSIVFVGDGGTFERQLAAALASGGLDEAIADAQAILGETPETDAMKVLREEAGRLGEESEQLLGVRNVGYFSLDSRFRSLYKISRRVERARERADEAERRELLRSSVDYEPLRNMDPLMKR